MRNRRACHAHRTTRIENTRADCRERLGDDVKRLADDRKRADFAREQLGHGVSNATINAEHAEYAEDSIPS